VIDETLLREAAATVAANGPGDAALDALRRRWPDVRFTVCADDDVPARLAPAWSGVRFNLYLIGGGEHCLALTRDHDTAIGIVVATVAD